MASGRYSLDLENNEKERGVKNVILCIFRRKTS